MPDNSDPTTPRLTGRPPTIDPDAVARTALKLFAEFGYDAVSMTQIASAANIGRKSLYRYFDSKADLVWGGLAAAAILSTDALHLASQSKLGLLDGLHAATTAAQLALPDIEVTRGRLRLIAGQPELLAQAPVRLNAQHRHVFEYLNQGGLDEQDAENLSVAHGSVCFAAWIRWARSEEPDPMSFLSRALSVLRLPDDQLDSVPTTA